MNISLSELLLAYRQAKIDAYSDRGEHTAPLFAAYESELPARLKRLQRILATRSLTASELGSYAFSLKTIDTETSDAAQSASDVLDTSQFSTWDEAALRREKPRARFRLMCEASVDFHVLSALWILRVGFKLDSRLVPNCYAYRVRVPRNATTIAERSTKRGSFGYYGDAYRRWRADALAATQLHLRKNSDVAAVTLDIASFYYSVNPTFILSEEFTRRTGISLTQEERELSEILVGAMATWSKAVAKAAKISIDTIGIPVGIPASRVIANCALDTLDRRLLTLTPLFYGRYVDDIVLLLPLKQNGDAAHIIAKLQSEIGTNQQGVADERFVESFATDAATSGRFNFSKAKQKIILLRGRAGLDLADALAHQLAAQASEWKLLPQLPRSEGQWYSQLIATTKAANLEADSIRKWDSLSVKRGKFASMLRDLEELERELEPQEWNGPRTEFYRFVSTHVFTPRAISDFIVYIPRTLELAFACDDYEWAGQLIARIDATLAFLETKCAGHNAAPRFASFRASMGRTLQAALCRVVALRRPDRRRMTHALAQIDDLARNPVGFRDAESLWASGLQLLYRDLARHSSKYAVLSESWTLGLSEINSVAEGVLEHDPLDILQIATLKRLTKLAERRLRGRSLPIDWLIFPTRLLSIGELTLLFPELTDSSEILDIAIRATRGSTPKYPITLGIRGPLRTIDIGGRLLGSKPRIALACIETDEASWKSAAVGPDNLSLARLLQLYRVVNDIVRCTPDFVVFPECSIPRRWALPLANRLRRHGISLICGLEYERHGHGFVSNQALISLIVGDPGYESHLLLRQEKGRPAIKERLELEELQVAFKPLFRTPPKFLFRTKSLHFCLLICSELTNIDFRAAARGAVDSLFVLEWNKDLSTFASLVEAAALDIHAYIIQSNNRSYGDSRIRVPHAKDWGRDLLRVKGGEDDFVVVTALDVTALRTFQQYGPMPHQLPDDVPFKPVPEGFEIHGERLV